MVCTLRVLADPTDGAALLRLLTGARWRIGPRDLVALHRRARAIAAARRQPAGRRRARRSSPTGSTRPPWSRRWPTSGPAQAYSAEGYARLRAYGRELALLRYRLDQPLPDLVADIERTIGLDVEVAVRAGRDGAGDAGLARGHLDALGDVAARFAGETAGAHAGRRSWPSWPRPRTRSAASTPGRGRGGRGRGADPHRARRQGPGVGRGRGGRADRGRVARAGARLRPLPRAAWACCRSRCAATPTGCPSWTSTTAADQRGVAAGGDRLRPMPGGRTTSGRSGGWRTWRSPARAGCCCAPGTGGARAIKRPRGPSVFLREVHDACLDGGPGAGRRVGAGADAGRGQPDRRGGARGAEWPADPLGARRPALAEAAGAGPAR